MDIVNRFLIGGTAALTLAFGSPVEARTDAPNSTGVPLARSTITGDWGGFRDKAAGKGVTVDLAVVQVEQGVPTGGSDDRTWDYGGRGDLTIKLDTGKAGLWPGGFLTIEAEGNWGDSVNGKTGAMMPATTNSLFPVPGRSEFGLPALNFLQFLSHNFGILIGKVDTMANGDANEFAAGGKRDDQFLNLALTLNPTLMVSVPYSTLTLGGIILPTGNPEEAVISIAAMSGKGKATTAGFDNLEGDELTYAAEGRVRVHPFGFTGHQLLGATYATRTFTGLDQRLGDILVGTVNKENDSWAVYYNFDQYFYEPVKGSGRGIGLFGRLGTSDGDANPIHFMCSLGIGGKGAIPGRDNDSFGLGWYYLDISRPTLTGPFTSRQLLNSDENGVELYYNIALTPWAHLTPDVQVILPAQDKHLVGTPPPFVLGSTDTAFVMGMRLKLNF